MHETSWDFSEIDGIYRIYRAIKQCVDHANQYMQVTMVWKSIGRWNKKSTLPTVTAKGPVATVIWDDFFNDEQCAYYKSIQSPHYL